MTYLTKSSKEFHINSYRLQYWVYALLNNCFGNEVKFNRDSLHKRYSVNRHSFDVESNTKKISDIKIQLIEKLIEYGFSVEIGYSEENILLKKINKRKTGQEELSLFIDEYEMINSIKSKEKILRINVYTKWSLYV